MSFFLCRGGIKNLENVARPQLEARSPESSALGRKQHIKIQHEIHGAAACTLLSISYAASADGRKQHADGSNQRFIQDRFITNGEKKQNKILTSVSHWMVLHMGNSDRC